MRVNGVVVCNCNQMPWPLYVPFQVGKMTMSFKSRSSKYHLARTHPCVRCSKVHLRLSPIFIEITQLFYHHRNSDHSTSSPNLRFHHRVDFSQHYHPVQDIPGISFQSLQNQQLHLPPA